MDFLLHERVIAALFRRCGVPFDVEGLAFGGVARKINNGIACSGDGDNLILPHLYGFLSVVNKRRDVGS